VLRLRAQGRQGGGGKEQELTTAIDIDLYGAVEDAAAHLYVWALKDIPQDLRDALADAAGRETSVPGQRVLSTILKNVQVADDEKNLVCQDTGIAVYTCRVGEGFPLHPARIYQALKVGTERATVEHPLRSNAVHTITRENTGPNTGYRLPIVHWEFLPDWDGLDVKCVPKGSGSENMSFLKMCVPADGVKGIKQFVLESIVGAGGKPCPPGIVGVGIGGSADYAMYLAKEAITRPIGTRNADPVVAQLEDELFGLLNETGIGPMGLGGDVTVLNCHIEHADTHMTLNPVAVNYQCWAARRATAHLAADGTVEYDREA
jgi:tartrate/fumarate subfamily iron-sulfur-dependent hydro-lyase alpha chain